MDLNALVAEYVDLAYHGRRERSSTHASKQAQAEDFDVEVVRDFDKEVGRVEVVPQEIGRVLLNLFSNAFDAVIERQRDHRPEPSGEGPPRMGKPYESTVSVSTRRVGDQVEIRVSDNGVGIPAEIREKIFEPFFTTKPTGSGTGLGLSLSYDIVTQGHGGTMAVESAEGEGAMFVVTLPVAREADSQREPGSAH